MKMFNEKVSPEISESTIVEEKSQSHSNSSHFSFKDLESPRPTKHSGLNSSEVSSTSSSSENISVAYSTESKRKKSKEIVSPYSCRGIWIRFSCLFLSPIFVKHRNLFFLACEVLLPALMIFGIIAAFTQGISWKNAYYEKQDSDKALRPKFSPVVMTDAIEQFTEKYANVAKKVLIVYTPVTYLTQRMMRETLNVLDLGNDNHVMNSEAAITGAVGVSSEKNLIKKIKDAQKNQKSWDRNPIGVIFKYDEDNEDETKFPLIMSFIIRHNDKDISKTEYNVPYVKPIRLPDTLSDYVETGFLGLQYAIEYSYLAMIMRQVHPNATHCGQEYQDEIEEDEDLFADNDLLSAEGLQCRNEAPLVQLQMFYQPNFFDTHIRQMIAFTTSCVLVVSYVFTSFFLVRQIILERDSGIKQLLEIHGLAPTMHWVILFFHAIFFRSILAGLVVLVLYSEYGHGSILTFSEGSLVFAALLEHLLSLTFFNFFIATMIKSSTFVGLYTVLIGLLSFFIPYTLKHYELLSRIANTVLAAIFPNWSLFNILYNIVDFECDYKGASWATFRHSNDIADNVHMTIFSAMFFMGISGAVYFIIALYRDMLWVCEIKLFAPDYSWWNIYARCKQYRMDRKHHRELLEDMDQGWGEDFEKPENYEEPPPDGKCYVRIRNLCKSFGKNVVLDSISLDIMHKEVTVIFGEPGSGKSTLIGILAGMISPTSGYAAIKNFDVTVDSSKARQFTGLSSQKCVYFNLLTVEQHVYLCYRLRSFSAFDSSKNTKKLLNRLKLWQAKGMYPDNMTNNELRRLNMAMAMSDAPKILLFDDPIGGLDILARRDMWNSIQNLKYHHTIIMTTSSMDEADYFADRIVFLSKGRLVCTGSANFLMKQFGTGYFLKCVPISKDLDTATLLELVDNYLGEVGEVQDDSSLKKNENDVIIKLPTFDVTKCSELGYALDKSLKQLGIKRYSFKEISLGDIFNEINSKDDKKPRDSSGSIPSGDKNPEEGKKTEEKNSKENYTCCRCQICPKGWCGFLLKTLVVVALILLIVWDSIRQSSVKPSTKPRNLTFEPYESFLKAEGGVEILYQVASFTSPIKYESHIKKILGKSGKLLPNSQVLLSTLTDILKDGKDNHQNDGYVKERHLAALRLRFVKDSPLELIGLFASGILHSSPIILNTLMNILLSAVTPSGDASYKIFCINHPIED